MTILPNKQELFLSRVRNYLRAIRCANRIHAIYTDQTHRVWAQCYQGGYNWGWLPDLLCIKFYAILKSAVLKPLFEMWCQTYIVFNSYSIQSMSGTPIIHIYSTLWVLSPDLAGMRACSPYLCTLCHTHTTRAKITTGGLYVWYKKVIHIHVSEKGKIFWDIFCCRSKQGERKHFGAMDYYLGRDRALWSDLRRLHWRWRQTANQINSSVPEYLVLHFSGHSEESNQPIARISPHSKTGLLPAILTRKNPILFTSTMPILTSMSSGCSLSISCSSFTVICPPTVLIWISIFRQRTARWDLAKCQWGESGRGLGNQFPRSVPPRFL